jgi:hypothetical protein
MNKLSRQTKSWWSAIALLALVWATVSPAFASVFQLGADSTSSYYTVCTAQGIQLIKVDASDDSSPIADTKATDCPMCQSHSATISYLPPSISVALPVKQNSVFFTFNQTPPRFLTPWQHPLAHAPPLV